MPKRKHRMNLPGNHRGFTLTEMMIVVALMAILAAIAVPNIIAQMPKYRLNGAARQVLGDLMAARMQAVSQNRNVQVSFPTTPGNQYTYDATGNPVVKNIQSDYHDVTVVANTNPIFLPNGTPQPFTNGTITLSNTSGLLPPIRITISSAGRVKIN